MLDRVIQIEDPHILQNHPRISTSSRMKMINWMFSTTTNLELIEHVGFIAIAMFDLYTSKKEGFTPDDYRLVAAVCFWIATKTQYDEILDEFDARAVAYCAKENDVVIIGGEEWLSNKRKEVLRVEFDILQTLGWKTSFDTPLHFLDFYGYTTPGPEPLEDQERLLKHLQAILLNYSSIQFHPAVIAATVLYQTQPKEEHSLIEKITGYTKEDLSECMNFFSYIKIN